MREAGVSTFVKFPHLPLEEAIHLVVHFINVSLSFSFFSSLSAFLTTIKVQVSKKQDEEEATGAAEDMTLERF